MNEHELICLHTDERFQVFLIILLNINHLFEHIWIFSSIVIYCLHIALLSNDNFV